MPQYPKSMFNKKLLFACILTGCSLFAAAQNELALQNLEQQFTKYQQQTPQEKVFVHTGKDFLLAGEILWFKVYAADAYSNKPTELSKVAYVEVIDADKKPVLQAKIKLEGGSGSGSFHLPTSIRSGNYTLRSYTGWMRNFSPELYFIKPVTIVNTFKDLGLKAKTDSAQYDMRLFPEGGNLVGNVQSKVAFRIIDRFGKGVDCSGKIVDQAGNTVTTFKPARFGIGSFNLTPVPGTNYTAVAEVGGKTVTQQLPEVYSQGYVMHADDADSQLNITVTGSNTYSTVFLLVSTGASLKTAEAKQLQNGKTVFSVDKAKLGDGITHFTVFNDQSKPVCERLYFKRPEQKLLVDIQADQQEYAQRKKTTVSINAKDETGVPQIADMSISVYRLDSLQVLSQQNIMSYLLLNADLRGTIESPDYYLTNSDAAANEALDNLMLTHGWSRFKWDDILQGKTAFDYLPEYEGHLITAKITDKKTGQPAAGIVGYLSVPGKNFKLAVAKSNRNGIVQFNVRDFIGGDEIILQTDQSKDSAYRIDIFNPFSEKFGTSATGAFSLSENMQGLLVQHSIYTQAQNIYHGEKTRQFYTADIDTLPFYGRPTNTYMLDDYVRFTTMEEVLREYIPEIAPRKQRNGFAIKVDDQPHNLYFEDNPLVMVDGVPFFNMDTVIALNPLKIRKLEVVAQKYYYGPLVLEGIVSYSTYKGDLDGIQIDPSSLVVEYDGMQLQREFYSPKYNNPSSSSTRLPDFRDVLYWSPDVKTGKDGKAQATFYTSDVPGTYAIIVQGITANGRAGSGMYTVTVK